jgi:hypothetical protein
MSHPESDASLFDAPFVFSADGIKSLYFTLDQLQSRMCSARPTQLEVDYTRTMMGFLMFNSRPANIAMIGLGGGSLLKFCYHHLPDTRFTVLEINPQVIALRQEFEVPEDETRIAGDKRQAYAHSAFMTTASRCSHPMGSWQPTCITITRSTRFSAGASGWLSTATCWRLPPKKKATAFFLQAKGPVCQWMTCGRTTR